MNNSRDKAPAPANNRGPQQRKKKSGRKGPVRQVVPKSIPAAYVAVVKESAPLVRTTNKSCRVVHSEFFHDVLGTVNGHFIQHVVSPSTAAIFPWLSGMASMWEHYEFNMLRFRYTPVVGTTASGTFAMAPDYDCLDAHPLTKGDLLSYDDKAHSQAYGTCVINCSKQNLKKGTPRLLTGEVPVGRDKNLYQLANLFFYTGGMSGTAQTGELYVEYDVTFTTPQAYKIPYPEGVGGSFSGTDNVYPFGTTAQYNNLITSGTMEAPVSVGTGSSQTIFTFLKAWTGFVSASFTGVDLDAITEGGTSLGSQIWTEIGFSTQIANCFLIRAAVGQTYILTIGNTSLTTCKIIFGQAPAPPF